MDARIEVVKGKIRATQDRAKAAFAAAMQESEAKIKALEAKLAKARGDAKVRLEARIDQARAEQKRRNENLHQAWDYAKQAMGA